MPRNIGGYVGISTQPVEAEGIARGIWNIFDYGYFKRLGRIPRVTNSLPVGSLILYAGSSNPDSSRFVVANGDTHSGVGTYAALYGVIGTAFGGSGGNFALPDLTDHIISHEPTNIGITTNVSETPVHDHGSFTTMGNVSTGGVTADWNNSVPNGANNARTANNGGNATKFRDHNFLPLISIVNTYLPAGSIIFTFRDTSKSRPTGKCIPCNGSTISPSQNPQLFSIIGNRYGGTPTSMVIPNASGSFPKCNKNFSAVNSYSLDTTPVHQHGPFFGYDPVNSTFLGGRAAGGSGQRILATGTTSAGSIGNGTEHRGDNFAAHAIIATELSELSPGDLVIYLGQNSPSQLQSLNGGTVPTATYPSLASTLESNFINGSNIEIIDCRNRYLRSTDLGAGRDPDAANRTFGGTAAQSGANICGTFQDQAFKSHTHTYSGSSDAIYTQDGGNQVQHRYLNQGNSVSTSNMQITYNSTTETVQTSSKINTKRIRTNICMFLG